MSWLVVSVAANVAAGWLLLRMWAKARVEAERQRIADSYARHFSND